MNLETLAAERQLPLTQADDSAALAHTLAETIATALNEAIRERGVARLALSGGRSPEPFLRRLNEQPVEWSRVAITLVDERWVPESDGQSNAAMVKRCLPKAVENGQWLPLFRGNSPTEDALIVNQAIVSWLPLDVIVLGMGSDGHCASLFPGQRELDTLLRSDGELLCAPTTAPDGAPRITLSAAALQSARLQILAVSGDDKYRTLCEAFSASPESMPVAAFLAPPLQLFYSSDFFSADG